MTAPWTTEGFKAWRRETERQIEDLYRRLGGAREREITLASITAGARVYRSTAKTIPDNTVTVLELDSEAFDDGFHSTSTNTSRVTIPEGEAGRYLLIGKVTFLQNSTGVRQASIRRNGNTADILMVNRLPNNGANANTHVFVVTVNELVVGDYVELYGFQLSGGDLDTVAGESNVSLTAAKIG